MKIQCNGQPRDISAGLTIEKLIIELGLTAEFVVVEQNGVILDRQQYGAILQEGDVLELIRFVGGG